MAISLTLWITFLGAVAAFVADHDCVKREGLLFQRGCDVVEEEAQALHRMKGGNDEHKLVGQAAHSADLGGRLRCVRFKRHVAWFYRY